MEDKCCMKSYIIRIELEESSPVVWRRVVMPAGATYRRLHDVIQNVTNFQSGFPYGGYHLYEFELKRDNMIVTSNNEAYEDHQHFKKNPKYYEERLINMDPKFLEYEIREQELLRIEVRKPTGLKIDDYLEKYKTLRYNYDFGDDWWFTIKLEGIVEDYYLGYPALLDGAEDAPPEDVGGITGFYEFLEAYYNPKHPEHKEMKEWGDGLDFMAYDPETINRRLQAIDYKKTEWEKVKEVYLEAFKDNYLFD